MALEFLIRHKTVVTFLSFFIFCIISLSVQTSSFTLTIEGIGSAMLSPFQIAYDYTQKNIHRLWAGFTELTDVREELTKTREKLHKYENITEELDEIKNENQHLRKILGLHKRIEYNSIPAVIISKDPDNWFRTIIINRGSDDGIKINMPVIAFNGDEKAVVGKVIEVRGGLSRVLPVIAPNMKMGVMLKDSRMYGLMSGYSANSSLAKVDYILKSEKVAFNIQVITSGQAGIFPKGLLVGKVKEIILLKSKSFKRLIIKPIIDYNYLSEVFVIQKIPDRDLVDLLKDGIQ